MERLLALLGKADNKVQAAAAAALWQLSGEATDDSISEIIGELGGAKAAVLALQSSVEEQRENVTGLIQSLAQSPANAVSSLQWYAAGARKALPQRLLPEYQILHCCKNFAHACP